MYSSLTLFCSRCSRASSSHSVIGRDRSIHQSLPAPIKWSPFTHFHQQPPHHPQPSSLQARFPAQQHSHTVTNTVSQVTPYLTTLSSFMPGMAGADSNLFFAFRYMHPATVETKLHPPTIQPSIRPANIVFQPHNTVVVKTTA